MTGLDLRGRVALVTGAGSAEGIGFAVARRLTELGASVAVAATSDRIHERARELRAEAGGGPAREPRGPGGAEAGGGRAGEPRGPGGAETGGGRAGEPRAAAGAREAEGFVADLTDPAQADALVAAALARFGRLDVLVNNAGMTATTDPQQPQALSATTDAQWRAALDRNLSTAFHVTRAALPAMTSAGFGRIVNVASTSGPVSAYAGDAAYHAAKAGMVGLTRALAIETAAQGITVNAVAPGWIATPSSTEEELKAGAATPVGRSGTPDEIAAVVALLAVPAASYLTGQLIVVDGANSIMEEKQHVGA